MEIVQVDSQATHRDFLRIPGIIYRDDPNWISHIDQEIEAVFDRRKNRYFKYGDAARWILRDEKGDLMGRVAAFINEKQSYATGQPTGGMGFFECIEDERAAFMLFDQCRTWLEEKGMEAVDGPINFGERERYWGLIIENFNYPPYYLQNYNPHYYVNFFVNYGFKIYYEQIIYHRSLEEELQEKYVKRAERIASDPAYQMRCLEKKRPEKYASDFRTVFNRAWFDRDGEMFREMTQKQAESIVKSMKPVMDENLMVFAYYEDRPIGFFLSLPEINQILKHVDGNLNWWGKIKFIWYKKMLGCTTAFAFAIGIDPDFQKKGLEGAMFNAVADYIRKTQKYKDFLIAWIGDFHPKMIHVVESLGGKQLRRMAVYRKLFDEDAVFERRPIVG